MKRLPTILVLSLIACCYSVAQQVRVSAKYNVPLLTGSPTDSVLNALKSIRGCWFDTDLDGDGKPEIIVTNYAGKGYVHVFENVGNDSMKLVWTSPALTANGAGSTPRYVVTGDLDNDGKKEIIFQSQNNGIYVFEWDGVVGSDNYGTQPSQVIGAGVLTDLSGNAEYMEVEDVDGDGQNELLVAINAANSSGDTYYIIHVVGDWSTNDPGFSTAEVEYSVTRNNLAAWGGGGSPYAMIAGNLEGASNKKTILVTNFNFKNVFPIRVTGANTYQLSDTTNHKQKLFLAPADGVALFGGMAYDIDGDGRDEIYLPSYASTAGIVDMISYAQGQSTAEIDSANNDTKLSLVSLIGATSAFGYGYGDINGNGKKEIYISTVYPYNLVSLEFQGGDKRNTANWTSRVVYAGDSTIFADQLPPDPFIPAIRIRDSLGVIDTTRRIDPSFASKIFGRNTDFDKDGLEDIILPYQALQDSMTILKVTWNATNSVYDTTSKTKALNTKRWGLRVIERKLGTGVEAKDLVIITPEDYKLDQNYPNPFNPSTTIRFSLPLTDRISLRVYDIGGKEIRTLIDNELRPAGRSEVVWNGKDNRGFPVSSGTYFYTLRFGNFQKTNKMIMLK
ncbi:MAG: FG-GAP-like repeat-containing protein [Bacteroidota bacterium]